MVGGTVHRGCFGDSQVYELCDRRLKENLYLMYVVHPSWWLRMAMRFMRTFVSGHFFEHKVHHSYMLHMFVMPISTMGFFIVVALVGYRGPSLF